MTRLGLLCLALLAGGCKRGGHAVAGAGDAAAARAGFARDAANVRRLMADPLLGETLAALRGREQPPERVVAALPSHLLGVPLQQLECSYQLARQVSGELASDPDADRALQAAVNDLVIATGGSLSERGVDVRAPLLCGDAGSDGDAGIDPGETPP